MSFGGRFICPDFGVTRKGVFQLYFLPRALRLCFHWPKSVTVWQLFTGPASGGRDETRQKTAPLQHTRPDRQLTSAMKAATLGSLSFPTTVHFAALRMAYSGKSSRYPHYSFTRSVSFAWSPV